MKILVDKMPSEPKEYPYSLEEYCNQVTVDKSHIANIYRCRYEQSDDFICNYPTCPGVYKCLHFKEGSTYKPPRVYK